MENYSAAKQQRASATRDFPPGFAPKDPKSPAGVNSSVKQTVSWVSAVRDFPPGCGPNAPRFSSSTLPNAVTGDIVGESSGARTVMPTVVKAEKIKKKVVCSKVSPSTEKFSWRRPVVAVKSKPVTETSSGKNTIKKPSPKRKVVEKEGKIMASFLGDEGLNLEGMREHMLLTCKRFRDRCNQLFYATSSDRRIDYQAWNELVNEGAIAKKPERRIGAIPGVEIGDQFNYRIELVIVGLHSRTQNGIDHFETGGCRLASCVVATEGYYDKMSDYNVLLYTGEGGIGRHKMAEDQKLKGGNLALYNSFANKSPVRVVRGLKNMYGTDDPRAVKRTYIYDGLYEVTKHEKKRGPLGNMIYEFELTRLPGQKPVNWKRLRA